MPRRQSSQASGMSERSVQSDRRWVQCRQIRPAVGKIRMRGMHPRSCRRIHRQSLKGDKRGVRRAAHQRQVLLPVISATMAPRTTARSAGISCVPTAPLTTRRQNSTKTTRCKLWQKYLEHPTAVPKPRDPARSSRLPPRLHRATRWTPAGVTSHDTRTWLCLHR